MIDLGLNLVIGSVIDVGNKFGGMENLVPQHIKNDMARAMKAIKTGAKDVETVRGFDRTIILNPLAAAACGGGLFFMDEESMSTVLGVSEEFYTDLPKHRAVIAHEYGHWRSWVENSVEYHIDRIVNASIQTADAEEMFADREVIIQFGSKGANEMIDFLEPFTTARFMPEVAQLHICRRIGRLEGLIY